MACKPLPTPQELRQLFSYNPDTGILIWKERPAYSAAGSTAQYHETGRKIWNTKYAGKEAGFLEGSGYRAVKVFDKMILAHRVMWALKYGYWPECIDHINGDPLDNRLCNLRDVSRAINQRNQKTHRSNTSGRTGVSWNKIRKVWVASIKINNRSLYLGSFDDFGSACKARRRAEVKFEFTGRA